MRATLIPYPAQVSTEALAVSVEAALEGEQLWLRFIVEGDVERIDWPAKAEPGRADELWKHTCFEAFVATDDGYCEFNLAPSDQWAAYRFDGYRQGMRPAEESAVVLGLDGGSDYVALEGRVDLPVGSRRLALSAVLEMQDGAKTYWALAHPSDKPDFHHPDSFILDLP